MKFLAALGLIAGLAIAAPATAGTIVINGDTTGGATFNRPIAPGGSLSGVGTNVRYDVVEFNVTSAGLYSFLATAGYDNYLGLYSTFDPSQPLAGVLNYNDDNPNIGVSGFSNSLLAGVSYFAVSTGFSNSDFGAYKLTISGPGDIRLSSPVPEPATWAMMIMGFGLLGSALRRKRQVALAA